MQKIELKIKNDLLQELCKGETAIILDTKQNLEFHMSLDLKDNEMSGCFKYLKEYLEQKLNEDSN